MIGLNNKAKVGLFELILSQGRKLIEAHFISFVFSGVMFCNFGFIEKENFFSISVFKSRLETDFMFVFPFLEI